MGDVSETKNEEDNKAVEGAKHKNEEDKKAVEGANNKNEEDKKATSPQNQNTDHDEFNQRHGVVFLIDVRKRMFERVNGDYYFKKCIQCCRELQLNLARKLHRNYVTGIVLIGVEKGEPKDIALLQELDFVSVNSITCLKKYIDDDFKIILETYGQSETFPLTTALNFAITQLREWKLKLYTKGIILMTCDDDPFSNDVKEAFKARKQAEDLFRHKIDLDLVPFGDFNLEHFYKELLLTAKDFPEDNWVAVEPVTSLEEILQSVETIVSNFSGHSRWLRLGPDRFLHIRLLKMYKEPNRLVMKDYKAAVIESQEDSQNFTAGQDRAHPPGASTSDITADQDVEESNENHLPQRPMYLELGGRIIEMSKTELNKRVPQMNIGFTLIGFYPTHVVPEFYTTSPPYLMVPDIRYPGSTSLWTALHSRCLDRGLSMLAWFKFTKGSRPRPVAINPVPSGFIVISLPYFERVVALEEETGGAEPSERQLAAADAIVKKLSFKYSPELFHDNEYRKRMAMIEALALQYPTLDEIEDDTVIDTDGMTERLGALSEEFRDCSHLKEEEEEVEEKGPLKKKLKADRKIPAKAAIPPEELIKMVRMRKAEKLTVAQLKEVLSWEGVRTLSAMTKPKLIETAYSIYSV